MMPRRIDALLSLIPPWTRCLADIGCGEGAVLAALRKAHPAVRLVGIDPSAHIHRLLKARLAAGDFGSQEGISFHEGLCFDCVRGHAPDVAVFAGLGQDTISGCLTRDGGIPDTIERLVVSSVDHGALIRPTLARLGWRAVDEVLAYQRGRYTLASAFEPGVEPDPDHPGFWVGPRLFEKRDPHLYGYLVDLRSRLRKTIAHARNQNLAVRRLCEALPEAIALASEFGDDSSSGSSSGLLRHFLKQA